MNNMLILAIISMSLLFGFILIGMVKFDILGSYSAYSTKWYSVCPSVSLWSIVTFISAALLIPILIELGENNSLQFLGFFAPVYLIAVSLTPRWESNEEEHKYHMIFAILCALCGVAWCLFVAGTWEYLLIWTLCWIYWGITTKTLKSSLTLIGELIAFSTIYVSLIVLLLK